MNCTQRTKPLFTHCYSSKLMDKTKQFKKVHISKMTGKLLGLNAISTNTTTNDFCIKQFLSDKDTICKNCYSHIMLNSYRKNMQACLQRNSDLLSTSILHQQQLPTILDLYFRFQAHGELINDIHFINLINICLKNPLTVFACWTKRKDIVNKVFKTMDKPKNLILIFSNPIKSKIMQRVPKHFDKTFNNVLENENIEQQNCTGQKCKDCLACYKFDTTTTIVEKVKKY